MEQLQLEEGEWTVRMVREIDEHRQDAIITNFPAYKQYLLASYSKKIKEEVERSFKQTIGPANEYYKGYNQSLEDIIKILG